MKNRRDLSKLGVVLNTFAYDIIKTKKILFIFMQLTKATHYAVSSLLTMAGQSSGEVFQVKDLADKEGISREFLAKIFQTLAKKGILVSMRGNRGGFKLARAAHQISLLDVLEALEGPVKSHDCQKSDYCHRTPCSSFHKLLVDLNKNRRDVLIKTSLASLVASDHLV